VTIRYSRLILGLAISLSAAWAAEVNTSASPARVASASVATGSAETIRTAQVWKATAAPRIVHGVVTIEEGGSLTIEAGAIVQFDGDLAAGIHVLGKLNVAGTTEKPVILQSAGANAGTNNGARWRGIWTDAKTARVTITGTTIAGAVTGVENRGGVAQLSSVEIKDSVRAALAGGKAASLTVEDAKLTNNTFGIDAFDGSTVSATGTFFKGNRTAVSANATGLYLASNQFENNQLNVVSDDAGLVKGSANLLMAAGKFAEVEVARLVTPSKAANVATAINADTIWTTAQSPILVSSNLRVAAGATLTIQPGVTVRFAAGGGAGLNVDGSLVAVGTDAKPIYFTSSLDNGTKVTHGPGGFEDNRASAGDWEGIHLNSATAKSTLEHVTVRYSRNGITAQGAAPVALASNTFRDDLVGVAVTGSSASVTSSSDTFVNNAAGVQMAAGHAALTSDAFSFGSVAISGAAGASASVTGSTVSSVATPVAKQTGFALTMNGSNALATVASLAPASSAPRAALRLGTQSTCVGTSNTTMPSFGAVPAGWAVDAVPDNRTAPTGGFLATSGQGTPTRSNELSIGIANGPVATRGNGIYQGEQFNFTTACGTVVNADLFIPSTWQQASQGPVATYLWATGNSGDYAAIGFRNYVNGQGQFSYWNDAAANAAFTDINPNSTPVKYGAWNNFSIVVSGTNYIYSVNGVTVATVAAANASTSLSSVSMYAVNFYDTAYPATYGAATTYTALWSDAQGPAFTSTSITTTTSGSLVNQQLFANEGAPPYTCSAGSVPAFRIGTSIPSPASNAGLSISANCVVSGTAPAPGSYTVYVNLTDSQGNNSSVALPFTVIAATAPSAPNIISSTPPAAVTGKAYSFTFGATGSGSLTWSVTAGSVPAGLTLNSSGILAGTPTATAGPYNFTVQVSGSGGTSTAAVTMTIYNALTITTTGLPAGTKGQAYGPVTVAASGGSGSYTWSASGLPAGLTISSAGQISGTPTATGTSSSVVVTATDSTAGATASTTFSITVTVQPLSIVAPSLPSLIALGGSVSGTFTAAGGSSPYTVSASGLPAGLTFAAGVLSGSPSAPGTYFFTVQVTDNASATSSTSITLGVLGFTPGFSLPAGTAGTQYSAQFSALGSSSVSFSSASNLDGLTLSASGTLSGKPTNSGTFPISVTVTSGNVSVTGSYTLSVGAAPVPLTLSGGALTAGQVLAAYSSSVTVSGGTAPYTFSVTGGVLPAGLTLSSSAGTISGTPTAAGTSAFTIQVADSASGKVSAAFTLQILPQTLTAPPTTFPTGVVGITYPGQVLSGNGGVAPYTFALASGSLPAGLTLTNGSITGTPTASGTFSFVISISDSSTPVNTVTSTQTITIGPNTTAVLILSSSTVSFSINNGTTATNLPASASISVTSSVSQQLLGYTVSSSAPWLTVAPANGAAVSAPGVIGIALNASALTLPSGSTSATIIVTCAATSVCAGTAAQNITINLTNTSQPPALFLTTPLLSFSTTGTTTPPSQSFGLQNAGGGSITSVAFTQADNWYTVTGVPATLPSGPPVQVSVSINPGNGLAPGFYHSAITFSSSAGTATLQVGLQIAANLLSLSQSGGQFSMTAGSAPSPSAGSFQVGALASASWTASVLPGASWLTVNTTSGTAAPGAPGSVGFSINSGAASLAAGVYFGTIQVAATSVVNSPLNFVVALIVNPAAIQVAPFPSPGGLLFLTNVGVNPSSQTVNVSVNSVAPVTFGASASASWLSVPGTGTASAASPGSSSVAVNTSGLVTGFYTGNVSYQINGIGRSVNVYLFVAPASVVLSHSVRPGGIAPDATCTPTKLFAAQTGLVDNFQQTTGLPTPLSVLVVNDCGLLVSNASVSVTFSDGDSPIQLSASAQSGTAGIYSGTWTPTNPGSQVAVLATAGAPGVTSASAQVNGTVTSSGLPILTKGSTTNVYSSTVGAGLAPGTIVQIYGSNLAATPTSATIFPLPTTLNGISVSIGGTPAPLYYVSPTQINAQLPSGLAPGASYQVVVSDGGAVASPDTIQVYAVSPGVGATVTGVALAQHAATFATITEASPATPGEFVTLYLSGLGATNPPVAAGVASPSNPPASASAPPTVTLNGTNIPISFAGLTPTLAGLFQINFQLPANTPNGDLQLVVTQSGSSTLPVILPVHN
jgi:uncharacterized protein (TIGR03437 family)